MTTEFISAYLINQRNLEDLIMNTLRTNDTRKVGDLISAALLTALGPNVTNNYAAPKNRNTFKAQVEGGDPVRSAERVPYSPSHQQPSAWPSFGSSSFGSSSFGSASLGSAQDDKGDKDDKRLKAEEANVAAA
jgi:hypothetical protein